MTHLRHDAQYSTEVIHVIRGIVTSDKAPVEGPLFDAFGGGGLKLDQFGRNDISGMELEPEGAAASNLIHQGNALKVSDYPSLVGCIVTSPCYGNRFADQYLGPKCEECEGTGLQPTGVEHLGVQEIGGCQACEGTGHNSQGRFSYAISLGRPVSEGSAAALHFHNDHKGHKYRGLHTKWLQTIAFRVLQPGPRRLILNMKDHYRTTTENGVTAQRRQYVCDWWIHAARHVGFRLVAAVPAMTPGVGYGANMQTGKADSEMVFVFDLLRSTECTRTK